MTNKMPIRSCNTNRDRSLMDDWDNSTNNVEYPVTRFSTNQSEWFNEEEEKKFLHF